MDILDKIIAHKKREVALKKQAIPNSQLEQSALIEHKGISLSKKLRESQSGIIAEHKRRSPSKSVINQSLSLEKVVKAYQDAGASGISILTDGRYFGGSTDDFVMARATTKLPLLRKDFIIDEYQILEAKAMGADVILLIASVLEKNEIKHLSSFSKSMDLEVLLEVHNELELEKAVMPSLDIIGVNNRNLDNFEVSLKTSQDLSDKIPKEFVKISESGLHAPSDVLRLRKIGYRGFLIGEHFMKSNDPRESAANFIKQITP